MAESQQLSGGALKAGIKCQGRSRMQRGNQEGEAETRACGDEIS